MIEQKQQEQYYLLSLIVFLYVVLCYQDIFVTRIYTARARDLMMLRCFPFFLTFFMSHASTVTKVTLKLNEVYTLSSNINCNLYCSIIVFKQIAQLLTQPISEQAADNILSESATVLLDSTLVTIVQCPHHVKNSPTTIHHAYTDIWINVNVQIISNVTDTPNYSTLKIYNISHDLWCGPSTI